MLGAGINVFWAEPFQDDVLISVFDNRKVIACDTEDDFCLRRNGGTGRPQDSMLEKGKVGI